MIMAEHRPLLYQQKQKSLDLNLPLHRDFQPAKRTWKAYLLPSLGLLAFLYFSGKFNPWNDANIIHTLIAEQRNPAYLIKAHYGAVASENIVCSDIGVSIMKRGGNAVDAAISSALCVGVVNMFSSGIGGGGFMTIRIPLSREDNSSEVYTVDFRETAPMLSNATMYVGNPRSAIIGGLSVGVPGEIRGLAEAHRRWGSMPWKRLVEPSVKLAARWKVGKELGKRIQRYPDLMLKNHDWSSIFAPEGRILREGEIIRRTNLSKTLSIIANKGPDAFYKGPIADAIVKKVHETGGILSNSDLEKYKVKVRRALQGTYRGRKVYTTHEPSSGPVFLHMLNLLEKFEMTERTSLNTHRTVEIVKFGFAARTKICDPAFNNDTHRMAQIPTKSYANLIFANITDNRTHPSEYYNAEHDLPRDHGTSHTSVVDKNGMAVALTTTVNQVFGSQVLDPVTGILLNDEMDDFSTPGVPNGFGIYPSPYNYPEAGKRPLSSTIPTIIEHPDGSFFLAVGGSGGSRIFGSVFQVLQNLDFGLDVSHAVEYGRFHNQLYPPVLDVDNVYPSDILDDLRSLGHNVTVLDINRVAAVIQAVVQKDGVLSAASDSRKNGIAAGY